MRATVPRKFTLLDAMVLIAATGIAFVPIRLFLWENWHFPEELSVPEIWRAGLEINVSLVPLARFAEYGLVAAGHEKTATEACGGFSGSPGWPPAPSRSCTRIFSAVDMPFSCNSVMHWIEVCLMIHNSAMFWIRIGMQPIFLVGGAVASVWIVMWLGGTWRAERSWIDRAGTGIGGLLDHTQRVLRLGVFPLGIIVHNPVDDSDQRDHADLRRPAKGRSHFDLSLMPTAA